MVLRYNNKINFVIDEEDYELYRRYKTAWLVSPNGRVFAVDRTTSKKIFLTNLVTCTPNNVWFRHQNNNCFDFRKNNLSRMTPEEQDYITYTKKNTPVDKTARGDRTFNGLGLYKQKNGKWGTRVYRYGRCIHLGTYERIEIAIRVVRDYKRELAKMEI